MQASGNHASIQYESTENLHAVGYKKKETTVHLDPIDINASVNTSEIAAVRGHMCKLSCQIFTYVYVVLLQKHIETAMPDVPLRWYCGPARLCGCQAPSRRFGSKNMRD